MARIIRTNPKIERRVSLRVVFSFLLFMQSQLPNARVAPEEKVTDISFYLSAKKAGHLSLSAKETEMPANTLALKAD